MEEKLRQDVLTNLKLARKGLAEAWYAIDEMGFIEDMELVELRHKIVLLHEDVTKLIEA